MIFIVWCAALTLDGLNKRIGLGWAKVGVLGDWLHFSSEIVWLPFASA